MLIKEYWGIENAPFWHFLCSLQERIPSNNINFFVTETHKNTHLTAVITLCRTQITF